MKRYYKNIIKSTMFWRIANQIKTDLFRIKWLRHNKHNQTFPRNAFDMSVVSVGNNSYGELNVVSFNSISRLVIGNYVSIAGNVTFLLDVEHHLDYISTYPFRVKILETLESESFSKGAIHVADDVWIGYGATIMSGVNIGRGAVIAAGALVVKDVPPFAVVGGVPAKIIKYRFDESIVKKIGKIDLSELTIDNIKTNEELLCTKVTTENVDEIVRNL